MRVNIYEEELDDDVQIVETTPLDSGTTFYGVRVFLKSSPALHDTPEDDDRSAVTFWVGTWQRAEILRQHLKRDLNLALAPIPVESDAMRYGQL